MKPSGTAAALVAFLWVGLPAAATTVKGSVRNGTTGRAAQGNDVILLAAGERGPAEVGRGRTDSSGRFVITASGTAAPALLRVEHQGVGYQAVPPPRGKAIEIDVYDVAKSLDAVTAIWDVRLQADGDSLKVIDEVRVLNASNPPRVLLNARPFAIQLPPEAEILAGAAQMAGGQAVRAKPLPGAGNGEYYFPFPLLPGENRFAVAWRLPYPGSAVIEPRIPYPLQRIAVVLPDSMAFEAASPGLYEAKLDESWEVVKQTGAPKPGQPASFRVSGTGSLAKVRGAKSRQAAGTASSHASQPASSHGKTTAPGPPPAMARPDVRLVAGGLVAALLGGSAVLLVAHRRRRLHRLPT